MQGLRTWEGDSLGGVDDSITNYVLHPPFFFFFFFFFALKEKNLIRGALIHLCKLVSNFLGGGEL